MPDKKKPAAPKAPRLTPEQLHAQARYTSGNPIIIPDDPRLRNGEGGAWGAFSFPDEYDRSQAQVEAARKAAWGYPRYGYQPPAAEGYRQGTIGGRSVPMSSPGAYGLGYVDLPWRPGGYNQQELMSSYASYSGSPVPRGTVTSGGGGAGMNYYAQPPAVKKHMQDQRLATAGQTAARVVRSTIKSAGAAAPGIAAAQEKAASDARIKAQKKNKDMRLQREITAEQQVPLYDLRSILWGQ